MRKCPRVGSDSGCAGLYAAGLRLPDHYRELQALVANLFGLSTQTQDDQRETAERLHLPFPVLSDSDLRFARALRLPTFELSGMTLIRRLTLIVRDDAIEHVFFPCFPPMRAQAKSSNGSQAAPRRGSLRR